MKFVCISDTHSLHEKMPEIPEGDILIHSGDCTGNGSLPSLDTFTKWFGDQPHKHKILVAGNHDGCFERYPEWSREMCEKNGILYLQDESVVIDGLTIFGSPWTPVFMNWHFMANEEQMKSIWAKIPDETDILITHGPSHGVLDAVPEFGGVLHVGCNQLLERTRQLKNLTAHIFGHIHEGYGIQAGGDFVSINASTCNERYQPFNPPITFDV